MDYFWTDKYATFSFDGFQYPQVHHFIRDTLHTIMKKQRILPTKLF